MKLKMTSSLPAIITCINYHVVVCNLYLHEWFYCQPTFTCLSARMIFTESNYATEFRDLCRYEFSNITRLYYINTFLSSFLEI